MFTHRFARRIQVPDRLTFVGLPREGSRIVLQASEEALALSIRLDAQHGRVLVTALGKAGVVLPETERRVRLNPQEPVQVRIELEPDRFVVRVGEAEPLSYMGALCPAEVTFVRATAFAVQSFQHRADPVYGIDWRTRAGPSGRPSTSNPFRNADELRPGVSFIVRAKNEAENIAACLSGIAPFAEEVIFVDNGSTDATLEIAQDIARRQPHIRVLEYPISVPRVGAAHAEAVISRSSNTLGEYYNWALSHASCYNFTKWDADFLTIGPNLARMYDELQLRTRGDNICLWYTGMEIYTDGARWWVDTATMQHEYRLFSKRMGCAWVDIPPWEELDQTYLYKARKLYFERPVYLEVFRLNRDEFANRGLYLRDARDRARWNYTNHYRETGELPDNFTEVSGMEDPLFQTIELTPEHRAMKARSDRIWSSVPIVRRESGYVVWPGALTPQIKLLVLIMSCTANRDRVEQIRATWGADLRTAGITFHFVVGRAGAASEIEGDVLSLDCPDNYEGLPLKTQAMIRYFVEETVFDYMLKVDDDTVLDVEQLWATEFWRRDYYGGTVAGAWGVMRDWHFGKCESDELNTRPYDDPYQGTWYSGGCGYFLSREHAELLAASPERFEAEIYEDKAVGDTLRLQGRLVGDLHETFACVAATELDEALESPALLVYDVPRAWDYSAVLAKLKSAPRPSALPEPLDGGEGELRVVTDWCDPDEFFRNEIAVRAAS